MKTQSVNSNDFSRFLEEHGINILSGEACGIGMRFLADVSTVPEGNSGYDLIVEFTGGMTPTHWGMNSDNAKTVLLPWLIIRPLVIYILLRDGANMVFDVQNNTETWSSDFLYAVTFESEKGDGDFGQGCPEFQKLRERLDKSRTYWRTGTARNGLVNRHEFSGRVE